MASTPTAAVNSASNVASTSSLGNVGQVGNNITPTLVKQVNAEEDDEDIDVDIDFEANWETIVVDPNSEESKRLLQDSPKADAEMLDETAQIGALLDTVVENANSISILQEFPARDI